MKWKGSKAVSYDSPGRKAHNYTLGLHIYLNLRAEHTLDVQLEVSEEGETLLSHLTTRRMDSVEQGTGLIQL